jgi:hypothetical protein
MNDKIEISLAKPQWREEILRKIISLLLLVGDQQRRVTAVSKPELNRILLVQECDARMMTREQMLVTKKIPLQKIATGSVFSIDH